MSQPGVATDAIAQRCAKISIAVAVVTDGRIAAVQRCPPARIPEVLIGDVDIPRGGQLQIVAKRATTGARECTANDCIAKHAEAHA
jgi:hypothetical protein